MRVIGPDFIGIQVAEALEYANRQGILHRDVKPSNVLITQQGLIKIVDFGLARVVSSATMTQTGAAAGTVGYMSPEQSLGKPVDRRTDIWALGVVFAEMLTGQNPFRHESIPEIVVAILNEPPLAMDGVPVELQKIAYRALSKLPANRYQSCTELRADLEMARDHLKLMPLGPVDTEAPTLSSKRTRICPGARPPSSTQVTVTRCQPGTVPMASPHFRW